MEGGVDILSPLLLVLLVLLALPALSWVFYGLIVLRAYAAVPPPLVSDGILLEADKVPALTEELERLRRGCIVVLSGRTKVPAHRSHDSLIARAGTVVVA
jgi:hypothetical protein